jgi:hypothetical protein
MVYVLLFSMGGRALYGLWNRCSKQTRRKPGTQSYGATATLRYARRAASDRTRSVLATHSGDSAGGEIWRH